MDGGRIMNTVEIDGTTRSMIQEAYLETVEEARAAGIGKLKAHMEGVTAAAMLVAATIGLEDEDAKRLVVGMVRDDPDIKMGGS